MPSRSIIDQLPAEAREHLKAKLEEHNFSDFIAITDEFNQYLAEQGIEIRVSKTGLWSFSKKWEEKVELLKETTRWAKDVMAHDIDDEGATNELAIRLFQQKVFQLAVEEELNPKTLATLAHAVADLSRASVAQKRWASAQREKLEKRLTALESEAKTDKSHLDPDTLRRVREEVYGIF